VGPVGRVDPRVPGPSRPRRLRDLRALLGDSQLN
jgi:hypothetical protein